METMHKLFMVTPTIKMAITELVTAQWIFAHPWKTLPNEVVGFSENFALLVFHNFKMATKGTRKISFCL